jgi:hypothetical protein
MRYTPKKLAALSLALVMAVSCASVTAFAVPADGDGPAVVANTIRGEANTDNFSTLKAYIDSDLTVPGNPVQYTGSATIQGDGKLDASQATITVTEGDGYFPYQLSFNGSAAANLTENADGSLSFEMHTGDLTWNNFGYPVQEGGSEWSGQGGDLNGQYHIRLKVSGLTSDGKAVDDVIVPVYIYIYGREFSDMASPQNPGSSMWGVGSLGEATLPYAGQAEQSENAVALDNNSNGLTWAWDIASEGEDAGYGVADTVGEILLCDLATDNLYITWPQGVEAQPTAEDVTITLTSEYGETEVLTPGGEERVTIDREYPANSGNHLQIPGGDYEVYNSESGTQISINYVHWLVYPVFSKMTIDIDVNGTVYSETFDVDSSYVYSVQTGGGLDLDKTVTVQNIYGIANIDQLETSDLYTASYSYYASSQPIQRPDAEPGSVYGTYAGTLTNKGGYDIDWTLTLNEDGSYLLHQYFAMMGQESDWYGSSYDLSEDGWVSLGAVDAARSSGTMGSGWHPDGNGGSCWLVDTGSKTILERDEDFVHYTTPVAAQTSAVSSTTIVYSASVAQSDGDYAGTYEGTIVNGGGMEIPWTLTLNADGTFLLSQIHPNLGEQSFLGSGWRVDGGVISLGPASDTKGSGWGSNGESCWLITEGTKTLVGRDEELAQWQEPTNGGSTAGSSQQGGTQQGSSQQGGSQQGGTQQGGSQQSGTSLSGTLFLAWNEDGTYYVTEDKTDENILTNFPDYLPEPELRQNGYFYYSGTASMQELKNDTIQCEYNGATYTFNRKVSISSSKKEGCLGEANLSAIGAELLPGFAPSAGNGMGGGYMNIGWAVFMRSNTNSGGINTEPDIGWTVDDFNLPFTDVTMYGSHEYYMVAWAYENGITNGVSATSFNSSATLNRAMAVTMLWRAAGKPTSTAGTQFTDVSQGAYYYDAVAWAEENGITQGKTATTFAPDDPVTREEFISMLYRYAASDPGASAATAAAWALDNGVANVANNDGATRFQAIAYLYRCLGD